MSTVNAVRHVRRFGEGLKSMSHPSRAHHVGIEGPAEEAALVHMGRGPEKQAPTIPGTGSTFTRSHSSRTPSAKSLRQ